MAATCQKCGEQVQELTSTGQCGWCQLNPVREFLARKQQIRRAIARRMSSTHCRSERPCRSCRQHAATVSHANDPDLFRITGQIQDEVERYIAAVEAMDIPRSMRVWDAQEELIAYARQLWRAAGAVREQIKRTEKVAA